VEAALRQFGGQLLKHRLNRHAAAPYVVRWVRQFLMRPAAAELLAD